MTMATPPPVAARGRAFPLPQAAWPGGEPLAPHLAPPWLEWDLGAPHRVLSWAVHRPGLVTAWRLLWREVRDDDLGPGLDVEDWLRGELSAIGAQRAVVMLTSRRLSAHVRTRAEVEGVRAECLATVGLSNAERIGTRRRQGAPGAGWGTINLAVRLSVGLAEPALIEAVSMAAEARTAAVLAAGLALPTGMATGTGTDCIAIAAPAGEERFAGLHTAVGEALGRAVHTAISRGVADWLAEMALPPEGLA